MDRLFDLVFVRPPPNSYRNCVSTNPEKDKIDVTRARTQHRQYVSVLKDSGVKVVELPSLEALPDSVFMQDPAVIGTKRAVIGRFGEEKRRGEETVLEDELKEFGDHIGKIAHVEPPATLEGGDIVVTDRGIFVGESSRTNAAGTRQLADFLPGVAVKPVRTNLFHLLCGCSYLNNGTMMIVPDLVDPGFFPAYHFVMIPKGDAYACDALYVGDNRVIIPAGYPNTSARLRDAGYRPIEVEMSEFRRGDGGVTCLSSPVYKVF